MGSFYWAGATPLQTFLGAASAEAMPARSKEAKPAARRRLNQVALLSYGARRSRLTWAASFDPLRRVGTFAVDGRERLQ